MIESATDDRLSDLTGAVAEMLAAHRRVLVTAESCTGGWLGKLCTDLPGSSNWYAGGAVVYSNELKQRLLGVRAETLAAEGAVSEAVVGEMAFGALQHLGGDVAVAISGIAGPDGGTEDKPVGTVWIAWAHRAGGEESLQTAGLWLPGGRDAVRRQALAAALQGLLEE